MSAGMRGRSSKKEKISDRGRRRKARCSKGEKCSFKLFSSKEGEAKDKDQESPLSGIILLRDSMAQRRRTFLLEKKIALRATVTGKGHCSCDEECDY